MPPPEHADSGEDPMANAKVGDGEAGVKRQFLKALRKVVDVDGDAKITYAELFSYAHKRHTEGGDVMGRGMMWLDKDKDGKVTLDEMESGLSLDETMAQDMKDHSAAKFKAADNDKDGLLTEDELVHYFHPASKQEVLLLEAGKQFEELDKDKDGKLTLVEFYGDFEVPAEIIAYSAAKHDHTKPVKDAVAQEFVVLDEDGDHRLSVEEFKHIHTGEHHIRHDMQTFLTEIDADGDGHVSMEEIETKYDTMDSHHVVARYFGSTDDEL